MQVRYLWGVNCGAKASAAWDGRLSKVEVNEC